MIKSLQKKIKLSAMLFCLFASSQVIAQTNLLTKSPSFESGSNVGSGSSLDGGQWARTDPNDQSNVQNLIYRQGFGNTTGAPAAQNGNYYLETVTPDDLAKYYAHEKLYTQNSQNLIDLGKGKTFRVIFYYQNTLNHSFKVWARTSNGANLGELLVSTAANDWTEASFDFTIPSDLTSTGVNLRLEFGLNAGTTRIDNIRIYDVETLPISLKSYEVTKSTNAVKLNWKTTSEIDNSHYEILRSADGTNFTLLQSVQALNLNKAAIYNYEDLKPFVGLNYYKLVQYDLNGASEELGVKAVNFNLEKSATVVYPNPFSNEITIVRELQAAKSFVVSFIGSSGKLVKKETLDGVAGLNSIMVQTKDLLPGIYTLLLENEAIKIYKK